MKGGDLAKQPTLYVVPYAHLDTQWRWEMPQTISEYLLKTMRVNFGFIDRYPHYVFNWTGANRYRLMKEYFPDDYARMKKYIAEGRWFPAGSSVEEGDVNLPSAEGIFRQVLYGNEYFRNNFGKASGEYMLPDCFGFPASLPAILAHAGVLGFSTQKLSAAWQPAPKIGGAGSPENTPEGIPFNVGLWEGPDGSHVLAALNPGGYGSNVYTDLSRVNSPFSFPEVSQTELEAMTPAQRRTVERLNERQEPNWVERINLNGKVTGVYADYHYVGTGDIGGATQETTVKLLEAIVTKSETTLPPVPVPEFLKAHAPSPGGTVHVGEGPMHVIEGAADQMFKDIKPEMQGKMPTYKGDLELINHSAGSLTSQAYHKRWVIKNEMLADAAEKASFAAAWMGGIPYPQKRLNDAWMLALGGHFHDTAAGTATPQTYEFAWNDDVLVANQFGGVLTSATASVADALDTRGAGEPLVLFNALNIDREDLIAVKTTATGELHVVGPDGVEMPAQAVDGKLMFAAKVPSIGYAVYHVAPGIVAEKMSELKVSANTLENHRYKVTVDAAGDVSNIYDNKLSKELLSAPIRLALTKDSPKQYPAWNMDYEQAEAAPRAYVSGAAKVRVKERGPVRVALEITREHEGSKYVQTVSLAAGDAGERVEFSDAIDWRGKAENLKVVFPLTASNPNATYNEDLGTIERPNAQERQFEVFSHKWIDLTDKSGGYGVTLLTDTKNGSDKPVDNTLRLTLLRTPGIEAAATQYTDQANQDWGHHEITYGLTGHAAGWREAGTDWLGYRLSDPVRAFTTTAHSGPLGKQVSLLRVDNPRVRVLAMKKAENSDEMVLRLVELAGRPKQNVHVKFAGAATSAREINAQEQPLGTATLANGELVTSFVGYQPRTFAIKMGSAPASVAAVKSASVALPYNVAAASNDDTKTAGAAFDGEGNALPAEMLPAKLTFDGVDFSLAQAATGTPDAVAAKGQKIALPAGDYNRVYILAASMDGDQAASFSVGSKTTPLTIENWGGFIGQWDTRLWAAPAKERNWAISAHDPVWPAADVMDREARYPSVKFPEEYEGLREGYVKPANVAWYASHFHTPEGLNQPYRYSYLFAYSMELPAGAKTLTLPNNIRVRVLAVSVAKTGPMLEAAAPLFDTLSHTSIPTEIEK
jgi:alpha-mannosidase